MLGVVCYTDCGYTFLLTVFAYDLYHNILVKILNKCAFEVIVLINFNHEIEQCENTLTKYTFTIMTMSLYRNLPVC